LEEAGLYHPPDQNTNFTLSWMRRGIRQSSYENLIRMHRAQQLRFL